jgi:hypothetical protein
MGKKKGKKGMGILFDLNPWKWDKGICASSAKDRKPQNNSHKH